MYLEDNMQPPLTAPEVKGEMLKADFWIGKTVGAKKLVLDKWEINDFNLKSFARMKEMGWQESLYDLKEYPVIINKNKLLQVMSQYSSKERFPQMVCFNSQGEEIFPEEKQQILEQANIKEIAEVIEPEFGILLRKESLRAFPTAVLFTEDPKKTDMDLFQLTTLSANSPLVILHKSKNKKWVYVQSVIYRGWLKRESIALVEDREEIFDFLNTESFLIIKASRVETEPNPFITQVSGIQYQMGDRLPLVSFEEIPSSIPEGNLQAQSPEGNYVIKVPVRDDNGHLQLKFALIARNNGVNEGCLAYTRENLIRQAFKMLGERYGWGGLFDRRDCSRFVMDIYRSVGIMVPRDAGFQEKGTAGEYLEFSGSIREREQVLDFLEAGDPIYMKGHVMIYLGKIDGKYYVIHDGAGYGVHDEDGKVKALTVHGVFVMELHQLLKDGSKCYLEALTCARRFK